MPRARRSNNGSPSAASSSAMERVTAEDTRNSSSAARAMLPCVATAMAARRWRRLMVKASAWRSSIIFRWASSRLMTVILL